MSKKLKTQVLLLMNEYGGTGNKHLTYNQIEVKPFGMVQQNSFSFICLQSVLKPLTIYLKENMKDDEIFTVYSSSENSIKHDNDGKLYIRCYSNKGTLSQYNSVLEDMKQQNTSLVLNKTILDTRVFAFTQHDVETNHWFDKKLGLRYSYHLQLVADIGMKYLYLLPEELRVRAIQGCYLHDSVEDARMTYRKLKDRFGSDVAADACRLCTNLGGHNREQRAGQWYYDKINESIVSVFIKFCDRIANIEHGILFDTPRKSYLIEMDKFLRSLNTYDELEPMRAHLRHLQFKLNNHYH